MLSFATACMPNTPEPPYGVWMSEEPQIMLFFKPQYRIPVHTQRFLGLYIIDGVELKVFVGMSHGPRFTIHPKEALTEGGGLGDPILLIGDYRVRRGEIHYTLTPHFQELLGIDTIIFRRVEYYDPIDPYYWSPHFFPRTEGSTP